MFDKVKSLFKANDSIQWVFGRKAGETKFNWNDNQALNLYEISLYANRAINKRADKIGEVEFVLKRGETEVENEWTELLRRPNEHHTGDQFWKLYQKYKDIFGRAYIYKEKADSVFKKNARPKGLHLLRPDLVENIYNSDETEIIAFDYSPTNGKTIRYTPDEVIYSFNPDPRYPLRGESLIRSGLRAMEIEVQANEYQAKSIKSGGNIDTVIKVKDALNAEQTKELREEYRKLKDEMWSEGTPDEPMFVGGDMDVLRLSLSPAELNYIESKKMTLDDISMLTNVPKDILGLTSGSTFANADASIRIFLRETIKPLTLELADILNWRLIPDEFELTVIDPTPEDKDEKRKDLETADKIHALTINEKRVALGLEAIGKEGDEIYIPINLVSLRQEKQVPEEKKLKTFNENQRRAFGEAYHKKLDRKKLILKKTVKDFFKDQEERLTSTLKKSYQSKNLMSETFNLTLEINLAKNALLPVIKDLFIEQGQEHLTFLGSTEKFNYTIAMDTALNKRADLFAQSINQTTFKQLQNAFNESTSLGESRGDLVNRIVDVYGDISLGRVEFIARTETHYALQEATLEANKIAGHKVKMWVWVAGVKGGVRDEHLAIDGEEKPVNDTFSTGQSHPADGDPSLTINCQCTII